VIVNFFTNGTCTDPPADTTTVTLTAADNGFLDNVDVKDILAFEKGLHDTLKTKYADLINRIEDTKDLSKDDEAALRAAIEDFKKSAAF
jgi:F-type H+-transporting ATPase subunit alpha